MKVDKTTVIRFIKPHAVILTIFGIGALLRFWPVGLDSGFRFHSGWNEAHYVSEAENFRKYGWFNQKPIEWLGLKQRSNDYTHPPLVTWIMCISILIFQKPELGGRIPIAIFGFFSLVVFYLVAKKLYPDNRKVGQIATLLFTLNPGHIYYSRIAQLDVPMLFFELLSLYFWLVWIERLKTQDKNTTYSALAGISLGLAVLSKFQALTFFVVPFFVVIFTKTSRIALKNKGFWIFLILVFLFTIFWPIVAYFKGDWDIMQGQLGWYVFGGRSDPIKFGLRPLTWYLNTVILWWGIEMFSLPILGFSLLGFLLLLLRRKSSDLFVCAWSAYYAILLIFWHKHDYYLLASVPSSLIVVSVFFSILLPQFLEKIPLHSVNLRRTTVFSYFFLLFIGICSVYQTHGILAYYKCYADFPDFRSAGLLIRENSPENALVIAFNIPILEYYSNRTTRWAEVITDKPLLQSYLISGQIVFVFIHDEELPEVHETWNLVNTYEIYKLYVNNRGMSYLIKRGINVIDAE